MSLDGAAVLRTSLALPQRGAQSVESVTIIEAIKPGATRRQWHYETRPGSFGSWFDLDHDVTTDGRYARRFAMGDPAGWGGIGKLDLTIPAVERDTLRGMDDARGWPWLAMWCSIEDRHFGRQNPATDPLSARGAIEIPARSRPPTTATYRALPLRVIPSGFARDTALFATAWFAMLTLFAVVRCTRRALSGRCPRCGYDVAFDLRHGCPECGWNRRESRAPAAAAQASSPGTAARTPQVSDSSS